MSLQLPNCNFCKHFHKNIKDRMCCDAFPEGIPPEKIIWGDGDAECANGMKYENEKGEQAKFIPESGSILLKMHRI